MYIDNKKGLIDNTRELLSLEEKGVELEESSTGLFLLVIKSISAFKNV